MIIQISFNEPINVSVQPGDMAYYTTTTGSAGFDTSVMGSVTGIGRVTNVNSSSNSFFIEVDVTNPGIIINGQPSIPGGSFIMFAKSNVANISGVTGHYANVTMRNDKSSKVELYSMGSDVIESSK